MDLSVPLIVEDGMWKHQIDDRYVSLSDIVEHYQDYTSQRQVNNAIEAFEAARFTGEMPSDIIDACVEKAHERLLLLNTRDKYWQLSQVASEKLDNCLDRNGNFNFIKVSQGVESLFHDSFGKITKQRAVGYDAIEFNGSVVSADNNDWNWKFTVTRENFNKDVSELLKDLTMSFYSIHGGKEYFNTNELYNAVIRLPKPDEETLMANETYKEPVTNNNYIVSPRNELDMESSDKLAEIVVKFFAYANKETYPNGMENEIEYVSSVFESTDTEYIGAYARDIQDFSDSPVQRIANASNAIYPVVDQLKDYILGFIEKNEITEAINDLSGAVKRGDIHITAPDRTERG